jgi:hypothetical protein
MVGCVVFANAVLERPASTTSSSPSHANLRTLFAPRQSFRSAQALRAGLGSVSVFWVERVYG